MSEQERQDRIDLAAAFRWAVRYNYHESIANHFTLAANDDGTEFFINPFGLHWSEIKASDLIRVNAAGKVLEGEGDAERSAVCIHGPIHRMLPHARCVLHAHPRHCTALTTIKGGELLPLCQKAARFHGDLAYDDQFNRVVLDFEEGERIAATLGNKSILFMVNHGVTVIGKNVADAFDKLYHLELSAENQVLAMSTGAQLNPMSEEAARTVAEQWNTIGYADKHFDALKRILDREEPDYAH